MGLDATHCPGCGTCTSYSSGADCHCGYKAEVANMRDLSAAARVQSKLLMDMLQAVNSASMLPLTHYLSIWWEQLKPVSQKEVGQALLTRALEMIKAGMLNDEIKSNVRYASFDKLISGSVEGSKVFAAAVAASFGELLTEKNQYELNDAVKTAVQEAVKAEAEKQTRDQREVIEAAVRDRMPSIEKLSQQIVSEVAEDMAAEVRSRMKRSGDKDGGPYR